MEKIFIAAVFSMSLLSLSGCAEYQMQKVKNMNDAQLAMCEMQSSNSLGYCKQEMNRRVAAGEITAKERNYLDMQACVAQPLKCQSRL